MGKQVLLISVFVLLVGCSAVMLSRQADASLGKFTLENLQANAETHHSKAQNYAAAAKWRFDRLKDENGNFYPSYSIAAIQQANNARSVSRSSGLGLQWQELGPDNVGGRTRAILIDKRDTTNQTIYAGGVSGGMWKSIDGANTWTRLSSFDNWVGISCIAQASAPDYSIYVGTGPGLDGDGEEGTSFASARYGNGIFKLNASDSGVLVTPSVFQGNYFNIFGTSPWVLVNRIAINPTNPNMIIAGTGGGLYKSTDAGSTWASVVAGQTAGAFVSDVKWSADGLNVYATAQVGTTGTMVYSNNGGTTWSTETTSANANFPAAPGRIEIGLTPANPSMVYILAAGPDGCTKGVYKSGNGGHSWTVIAVGGPLFQLTEEGGGNGCQGFYDLTFAISPTDTDKFYMGGVNFYTGSGASGVRPAAYGYSNESNPFYMHPDNHAIVIADNNPNLMFIGCDGGIFKSTNALSAFPNPSYTAQNRGYNVTQCYGIGAGIDGSVIGGSQDNGTNYVDYNGSSFGAGKMVLGGDGFLNYVSGVNPNFYFGAIYYAALYRSSDHAATFGGYFDVKVDPLGQGGATVCGAQLIQQDAQFCTPYYLSETFNATGGNLKAQFTAADRTYNPGEVVTVTSAAGKYQYNVTLSDTVYLDSTALLDDPIRSRILMSATCGVYITSDALNIAIIPRWFALTNQTFNGNAQSFVTSTDGNTLYIGTTNGYFYKFSDFNIHADTCKYPPATTIGIVYPVATSSSYIYTHAVAPGRSIEGIAVDPNDDNHIVAVVAGFSARNQAHVFETTDGGVTWKADTTGLPNMPVYTVVIHSTNSIIIGTEFGAWSWDGSSWHEEDGNFERVPVYRMIERNLYEDGCKVLYLGSHGRGMWRSTTLTNGTCNTNVGTAVNNVKPNAISGLNVFPNPVHNSAKISLNIENNDNVTIRIFDLTGKLYSEKSYKDLSAGTNLIDLDATGLSSGSYLCAATVGNARTMSKLFIVAK